MQTRPPKEIIVVDDGSADGTGDFARSLGATVYTQDNRGVAAARNTGIVNASEQWIALLDADDRWLPDKLATQWEALRSTGDDICATDFAHVHRNGSRSEGSVSSNRGYRSIHGKPRTASHVTHLTRAELAYALPVGMFLLPSTLLFKRTLASENGEFFRERDRLISTEQYHIPEDVEWILRALRWSDVTLVKRVLVEYSIVPGSLSSNVGRMRYGDAKLGELVGAESTRYVDGAAERMKKLRESRLREASVQFMRQLEFVPAGAAAGEAFASTRRPIDAILWMSSHLLMVEPAHSLARAIRAAWRLAWNRTTPFARGRKIPD
jgi:glycosyltransferase involved in cell wall biosynthesis